MAPKRVNLVTYIYLHGGGGGPSIVKAFRRDFNVLFSLFWRQFPQREREKGEKPIEIHLVKSFKRGRLSKGARIETENNASNGLCRRRRRGAMPYQRWKQFSGARGLLLPNRI